MDRTDGGTLQFGTPVALPSPPFATAPPSFATATRGGVAVAFADPAGGTRVAVVDGAGRWGPAAHLALSTVGIAACGDELLLGGLRLPDGDVVAMALEGGALTWTAALPASGRLLHGPFPICAGEVPQLVWTTLDADGMLTLCASRVAKGAATPAVAVKLDDQPLELDVITDGDAPAVVWTGGPRLALYAAHAGAAPVFQALEGSASPRWLRTARGLAWVAVGPMGLCAQRVGSALAPAGAQLDLGEGFAPLALFQDSARLALVARGPHSRVGQITIDDPSGPRHEPVYATGAWLAPLDAETLALGPRVPVFPAGRYLAAAFLPDALLLVHGEVTPCVSAFPMRTSMRTRRRWKTT